MVAPPAALDALDNGNKFCRRLNRPPPSFLNDRPGNPARIGLLPIVTKDSLQLSRGKGVYDFLRVQRLAPVHAHVEPRLRAEAEPSLRSVDLMR